MKIYLSFIFFLFIVNGCGEWHPFNPHTVWRYPEGSTRIDKRNSKIEDLTKYEAYYKIIWRHDDSLEQIYKGPISQQSKIHITDIQYLLINNSQHRFIIISCIPIRNISKCKGHYLDRNRTTFHQSINLNRVKMINYGNIIGGCLINTFRDGEENRNIHYSTSFGATILKWDSIYYPGRKDLDAQMVHLNTLMPTEYLTFHRMDTFSLTYVSNNIPYVVRKEVDFMHMKNGKNLIKFEYENTYPNNCNKGINCKKFYIKEQGSRFNFLYP